MQKANFGDTVTVHYKGTLVDGTEFDNSYTRQKPMSFELGSSKLIAGFNNAVAGMTVGEKKTVELTADQAYGQRNPQAIQQVPKTDFGPDFQFRIGGTVRGNGPLGPFLATIDAVSATEVTLDMNHPLAGKVLIFNVELLSIEEAQEEAEETETPIGNWSASMKKAELLEVARSRGLGVNTRSTKAQIIEALQA